MREREGVCEGEGYKRREKVRCGDDNIVSRVRWRGE